MDSRHVHGQCYKPYCMGAWMQLWLVQWQISPSTSCTTVIVTDGYFGLCPWLSPDKFHACCMNITSAPYTLHNLSVDVMGFVFCAHRNQITVLTSSLFHLLSTVAIFQVTLYYQYNSCTSVNTCHLVDGTFTNAWQNSSLQSLFYRNTTGKLTFWLTPSP